MLRRFQRSHENGESLASGHEGPRLYCRRYARAGFADHPCDQQADPGIEQALSPARAGCPEEDEDSVKGVSSGGEEERPPTGGLRV